MKSPIRPYLSFLHRWTGVCAGILFVLVALTGAAMAYRVQLEAVVDPALLTAPACSAPLSLDVLIERARAAHPQSGQLKLIRLYGDTGATARVRFDDGYWIYVDRCSGRVAGRQAVYTGLFGTLGWLHIFGFVPNHDLFAGVLASVFALTMLAAGIVLWWPATRRALRAGIRLTPGLEGRAFSLNLHKTIAFYAAPVLLASALTGLPLAFQWGQAPSSAVAAHAPHAVAGSATLQQMWQQAQSVVPQPQKVQVRFPAAAGAPVIFEMVAQSAPHANALSYVHIDPRSGRVLEHMPHSANRVLHQVYLFAAALHYGWIGGVAGQLLLMLGALAVPVLAWTGTASFLRSRRRTMVGRRRVTVACKTTEAQGVYSFELVDSDGKPLPPFTPGAHIDVYLPGGLVRQYSLCNDPRETHRYLIAVMHATDSRGGSRAMHETVNVGDSIDISLPRNHFMLAQGGTHALLFAGGIGVTPILSMAEWLAGAGIGFSMHYCVRSPARAAFRERIAQSAYADRVFFHYSESQRLDLTSVLAAPDGLTHLYVCGPTGFMEAVICCALAHGWSGDHVHREYFVAAPVAHADDTAFDIRIASSGAIVHVPNNVTALDALAASGIEVPSSCLQGVCGTCVTQVTDGEPDHRDLFMSAAEHAVNRQFAPCCSRSRSAVLTLDL